MQEAIIYDDILNKFQHLKTPYIICTLAANSIYNEYIRPYLFITCCFYDFR